MKCEKCGSRIRKGAKFCDSCGAPIGESLKRYNGEPKKRSAAIILLLCLLIGIVLFIGVSFGTFIFVDNQSDKIKESYAKRDEAASQTMAPMVKTPEPTREPEAEPTPSAAPVISSRTHLANPTYSVYQDAEYGFSCAYPTHFEKYTDNSAEGRYTLKNSDGTATLRICAENNNTNMTLAQSLSMFTAKTPGDVEMQRTGGTYYMIKINESGICRYRYLVSKNNKLCWFDFTYPKDYESIYDGYTQHLYETFTVK